MRYGVVRPAGGSPTFAVLQGSTAFFESSARLLPATMDEALVLPAAELQAVLGEVDVADLERAELGQDATLLAPIGRGQEVWASGVTYERSKDARVAEARAASVYDMVYEADRPELFLKAPARLVVGSGEPVGIRADSTWNVPEPELALVLNASAELVGYTLGNDMSSRSIEGENPLYLPQAKTYERSCALGPAVVPAWELDDPAAMRIGMTISRGPREVFAGQAEVAAIRRPLSLLVDYLFRALEFPWGVILLTGTGVVPREGFTLAAGDVVRIAAEPVGELTNPVTVVGGT
jgi:2-dehydro-3-deoxy-D-arabinonate dehydratase